MADFPCPEELCEVGECENLTHQPTLNDIFATFSYVNPVNYVCKSCSIFYLTGVVKISKKHCRRVYRDVVQNRDCFIKPALSAFDVFYSFYRNHRADPESLASFINAVYKSIVCFHPNHTAALFKDIADFYELIFRKLDDCYDDRHPYGRIRQTLYYVKPERKEEDFRDQDTVVKYSRLSTEKYEFVPPFYFEKERSWFIKAVEEYVPVNTRYRACKCFKQYLYLHLRILELSVRQYEVDLVIILADAEACYTGLRIDRENCIAGGDANYPDAGDQIPCTKHIADDINSLKKEIFPILPASDYNKNFYFGQGVLLISLYMAKEWKDCRFCRFYVHLV